MTLSSKYVRDDSARHQAIKPQQIATHQVSVGKYTRYTINISP